MTNASGIAIWIMSAAAIVTILVRPFRIAEWVWAVGAAGVLVVSGLLPAGAAAHAVLEGSDVYLFLGGMLVLSELARVMGLFDVLADILLRRAGGTTVRLFTGVYIAGMAITALLSNDGTILLLTPAVLALARRTGIDPLPYLYACAFVSNAASYILPISNPANLVVFRRLPALLSWLQTFWLSAAVAVLVTYAISYIVLCRSAPAFFGAEPRPQEQLTHQARLTAIAVSISALLIIVCAGLRFYVGPATFVLGAVSVLLVAQMQRTVLPRIVRETPWSIVPLVAGLFVIVAAIDRTGALAYTRAFFARADALPATTGNLLTGFVVMLADNVLNNLPAGILVRFSLPHNAGMSHVAAASLIGVDLGPNLSVAGSLATLLWLLLLRREGINVTAMQFLRAGILVTIASLSAALLCLR